MTMLLMGAGLGSVATGPDPETASAVVSGAGTGTSNGTYDPIDVSAGKTTYGLGDNQIYWTGAAWNILDNVSLEAVAYSSNEDVAYPWLVTTWTAVNGAEPVPTVTIG